jgi:hypothetical protein
MVYDVYLPGVSGLFKCELLPILPIRCVCFGLLMTFNRQEATVNTLLVRYPQFSYPRVVYCGGSEFNSIPATSLYKIEVFGTFVIQESLYPCHL